MRFAPPEEEVILYEEGFKEDFLNRKKIGKALSDIVERTEDPLVLALDGQWGSGKTHFLRRWAGAHTIQNGGKATTVYFDAFANDYFDSPLVGLISALSVRMPRSKVSTLSKLKRTIMPFVKPATRIGIASLTSGGSEVFGGVASAAIEATGKEATAAVDEFWKQAEGQQGAMNEVRAAISTLTAPENGDENRRGSIPLIIIVDELDRCRPDYALAILEVIKHFFAVPHVHFILGVNLEGLENSVKARYGADIDAERYLRKFVSTTFALPDTVGSIEPKTVARIYIDKTAEKMGIPDRIINEIQDQAQLLSRKHQISLRDLGKVLSSFTLLPDEYYRLDRNSFNAEIYVATTLIFAKTISPKIFNRLLSSKFSEDTLVDYFGITERDYKLQLDNHRNNDFNREIHNLYVVWLLIGDRSKAYEVESGYLKQFFPSFSLPNSFPRTVWNNWLNLLGEPSRLE